MKISTSSDRDIEKTSQLKTFVVVVDVEKMYEKHFAIDENPIFSSPKKTPRHTTYSYKK